MNILLVCDGNTCRSVMAEALGKQRFPGHRWRSRGLAVVPGSPTVQHTAVALGDMNEHVENHVPTLVTATDVEWADAVYAMTTRHVEELAQRFKTAAIRLDEQSDVADPFGDDPARYRRSLDHIEQAMLERFTAP